MTSLPIPRELAVELSAAVARWGGDYVVTDRAGQQSSTWAIERAIRSARPRVAGLPEAFRFHDLRHYLASLYQFRQRARREGRPAPTPARECQDNPRHLRAPVARQRRVRTGRRCCCAGGPWGLVGVNQRLPAVKPQLSASSNSAVAVHAEARTA